jgi:hypothetical protein
MQLILIFCEIDDFCKDLNKIIDRNFLTDGSERRNRSISLSVSEIMTITVYYHHSGYKIFKDFYERDVLMHMSGDFPHSVSYNRFIELKQKSIICINALVEWFKTMHRKIIYR